MYVHVCMYVCMHACMCLYWHMKNHTQQLSAGHGYAQYGCNMYIPIYAHANTRTHADGCTNTLTDTHVCLQDILKYTCVKVPCIHTCTKHAALLSPDTHMHALGPERYNAILLQWQHQNMPWTQPTNVSNVPERTPTRKHKSTGTCISPHHAYTTWQEHENLSCQHERKSLR